METKQSKYPLVWGSMDGRKQILEEMDTDHLLNVYKHIENNLNDLCKIAGGKERLCATLHQDWETISEPCNINRGYIKAELLSRGVSQETIENHIEDKSKMLRNLR